MNESSNEAASNFTAAGLTPLEQAFYLGTGITGFAFNALVLFIAFRFIDTHDKPRQLIVINMTASDLMMCLVYMTTRPYLQHFPSYTCYPYYVIVCSSQLCSCFNLLWLNLDKLIFVQFPLHYYSLVTRTRLMVLTTSTWLIIGGFAAIGYSSLQYVDDFNKDPEPYGSTKTVGRKKKFRTRRTSILSPASNSTKSLQEITKECELPVSRWSVYRVLKNSPHIFNQQLPSSPRLLKRHKEARMQRARENIQHGWSKRRCDMVFFVGKGFIVSLMIIYVLILVGSFITSVIIFTIARRTSRLESSEHSKIFRQLFFLFSSTLWTFFTCLPYRALYLYANIENVVSFSTRPPDDFFHVLVDLFFRILVLGMVINPLITILTQRIYRMRLLRYLQIASCRQAKKNSIDYSVVTKDTQIRRTSARNQSLAECQTLAENTADF